MKTIFFFIAVMIIAEDGIAQNVGIGTATPHLSAALEVKAIGKGLLIPRTSATSRTSIAGPAKGLLVYDTTTSSFWFHTGTAWSEMSSATGNGWGLTGNAGTNPINNFIGTTDAQPLLFKVNNIRAGYIDYNGNDNTSFGYQTLLANTSGFYNTALGYASLKANTTGSRNTGIGFYALTANNADNNTATGTYALSANTSGIGNVANGLNALASNINGNYNAAFGTNSLYSNTSGLENTANGYGALFSNLAGNDNAAYGKYALYNNNADQNTALGFNAMFFNTTGVKNTATGSFALQNNVGGQQNTATGYAALSSNTDGNYNAASGAAALNNNTTGIWNTAHGAYANYLNSSGNYNTATGGNALYKNIAGINNTAYGYNALYNNTSVNNTAIGTSSLFTNILGIRNTAVGFESLFFNNSGTDNTAIGFETLLANTSGNLNTALGVLALSGNTGGFENTAVGYESLSLNTGFRNTALGSSALSSNISGTFLTSIGYNSNANSGDYHYGSAFGALSAITASYQVRIGSIGAIADPTSIGGKVDWTTLSDGRVKKNIKENVPGLLFITKLKPITYTIDEDAVSKIIQAPAIKDKNGNNVRLIENGTFSGNTNTPVVYSGFIAQDVEKTARSINYDFNGIDAAKNDKDLYGLRYAEFVVPLVKAIQEQQTQIETLRKENEAQKKINGDLLRRLNKLESQLSISNRF
jgi:hypothetical protein